MHSRLRTRHEVETEVDLQHVAKQRIMVELKVDPPSRPRLVETSELQRERPLHHLLHVDNQSRLSPAAAKPGRYQIEASLVYLRALNTYGNHFRFVTI